MTFKVYVTAVMNKMTYVSFHKVGWEQPLGKVGNYVAVLLQIYFSIHMIKIIKIQCVLAKLLQKWKGAIFLSHSAEWLHSDVCNILWSSCNLFILV